MPGIFTVFRRTFFLRVSGFFIGVGFFLPWCASQSGAQFASSRPELWLIFLYALLLILVIPTFSFFLFRLISVVGGVLVVIAMIEVARKFGPFREIGVWVTLGGGILNLLVEIFSGVSYYRKKKRKKTPPSSSKGVP
jgi:hypothetical protein